MTQPHPARSRRRRARLSALTVLAALLVAAALLSSVAAAQSTTDPRAALAPGFTDAGVAASGIELLANRPKPAGFFNPANPGDFGFVNSDLALAGQPRVRRELQRLPDLRHLEPGESGDPHRRRLPGRPGRGLGLRQPALHVGRGDARAHGLRRAGGPQRQPAPLPRRPHLRHQQPRRTGAGGGRADLPRLAHAHAAQEPERRGATSTCTCPGPAACGRRSSCPAARTRPPTDPSGALWRIEVIKVPLAAPQTAAIVNRPHLFTDPVTGRNQRAPERAPDAPPSVGDALVARRRPRTRATTSRRTRSSGSRPPPARGTACCSTSATRRTRAASTRCPIRTTRTGTARRSRTTGRRSCSPTSGAAAPRRAAASPTSSAGARTRSTTSSTRSSCSAATTSCRSRRRTRRTASPTCPRSCRFPAATSWCRPGTRAACRSSTSPTPPTRGRSATTTAARSAVPRSSSAACGRRTTSTAPSSAPRSHAASTPSA